MSSTAKLSVIHIVSSLNVGGAERFVIDLCQEQLAQHITPAILSFGSVQDTLVDVCDTKQIPLTVIKGKSWQEQKRRLALLSGFDVIHIHSPAVLKSLVFHLFFLRHKRLIYTRHGALPLDKLHWVIVHRIARHFINYVTFVSAEAKQNFGYHAWHNVPHLVIDNGVVLPLANEIFSNNNSILKLGSVGRMVGLKGQISLLKAVSQLSKTRQQQVELHFFGDGELRVELETYAEQHVKAKTVFHGVEINRENIYPHIDALVVTSSTEGLSMVILEAMAYGKPVIATNVGGNPVLVKPEQTGWLYEYNDISALAELITNAIDEPQLLVKFGLQAREWVAEYYSLERTATCYQELYRAL